MMTRDIEERHQELTELVEQLPDMSTLISHARVHSQEFKTIKGTCISFGLFKNHDGSVVRAFASGGTVFPVHCHKVEREFLGVLSGQMILYHGSEADLRRDDQGRVDPTFYEDPPTTWRRTVVRRYGMTILEPGTVHFVVFPEDTWHIVALLPGRQDWPEGPDHLEAVDLRDTCPGVEESADAEREGRSALQ